MKLFVQALSAFDLASGGGRASASRGWRSFLGLLQRGGGRPHRLSSASSAFLGLVIGVIAEVEAPAAVADFDDPVGHPRENEVIGRGSQQPPLRLTQGVFSSICLAGDVRGGWWSFEHQQIAGREKPSGQASPCFSRPLEFPLPPLNTIASLLNRICPQGAHLGLGTNPARLETGCPDHRFCPDPGALGLVLLETSRPPRLCSPSWECPLSGCFQPHDQAQQGGFCLPHLGPRKRCDIARSTSRTGAEKQESTRRRAWLRFSIRATWRPGGGHRNSGTWGRDLSTGASIRSISPAVFSRLLAWAAAGGTGPESVDEASLCWPALCAVKGRTGWASRSSCFAPVLAVVAQIGWGDARSGGHGSGCRPDRERCGRGLTKPQAHIPLHQ